MLTLKTLQNSLKMAKYFFFSKNKKYCFGYNKLGSNSITLSMNFFSCIEYNCKTTFLYSNILFKVSIFVELNKFSKKYYTFLNYLFCTTTTIFW